MASFWHVPDFRSANIPSNLRMRETGSNPTRRKKRLFATSAARKWQRNEEGSVCFGDVVIIRHARASNRSPKTYSGHVRSAKKDQLCGGALNAAKHSMGATNIRIATIPHGQNQGKRKAKVKTQIRSMGFHFVIIAEQ